MTTLKDVEDFLQSEPNDIEEVRERFLVIVNAMIQYTTVSALIRTETQEEANSAAEAMLNELTEMFHEKTKEAVADAYLRKGLN